MTKKEESFQVHIINASAGSGKTYALAKKYLVFLLNSEFKHENLPQKNILAITFTNKATNEMKQRILEFLKKIALDMFSSPEEKEDILSGLGGIDQKTVRQRAYAIIDLIIRNYDFFRVQTIDSFINSVISGCSFNLDISSGFNIETDYAPYLDYCLDRLIEQSQEDKQIKSAFMDFIDHYIFVENNTGWFPKQKMSEIIKNLFECSNTYGMPFKKSAGITNNDLIEKKKETFLLIEKLAKVLPENVNGKFRNSINSFLKENTDMFGIGSISTYFDKGKNVPMNKDSICPDKVSNIFEVIQKNLKVICETEAYSKYYPYITIYELVMQGFKTYTQKKDVLFLNELNKKAKSLFDVKSMTVPELYYRLATRFRYYLVDEFQDTSRLQWTNLSPMVDEAVASGGSLFYVGDKKQAIYGFRGGEYGLFDEVRGNYKHYAMKEDTLNKNYRSQKEIVEFNNRIFSQDNLQRFLRDYNGKEEILSPTQINEITGIFSESQQTYKKENVYGYVKVEPVEIENKEQGQEIIKENFIKLIRDLRERVNDGDICVLLRDNNEVELVTGWLLEQKDIPVESEKTLNIRGNFLIKELFSFLMFLHSPLDNISFASFILGDIFIKETKIDKKILNEFLFDIGSAKRRDETVCLYVKFREAFSPIWDEYIKEFINRAGLVPLYEFVISMLSKYSVLKNFPQYQGFVMAFLELIKTQEQENRGLESFIEYFNTVDNTKLFVNVTSSNSIKITTIHKAKGLEFGVVIIPFLDINNTEMKRKISQYFVIYPGEKDISLVRVHQEYCGHSALLESMYINEIKKSLIEELNTAYVAFTRAKNELYVFIPVKKEENLARLLILPLSALGGQSGGVECGKPMSYKEIKVKEVTIQEMPPSDYRDWMKLIENEFADDSRIMDRNLVTRGEVIHYLLSCINDVTGTNIDDVLNRAIMKTEKKFPFVADMTACGQIVRNIVNHKECRRLFSISSGIAGNEKEIVDAQGNARRIDRLVVTEKEVWVVDYKISELESEEHRSQIANYMHIVSEVYPDKKVKGFLLYVTEKGMALKEMGEQSECLSGNHG